VSPRRPDAAAAVLAHTAGFSEEEHEVLLGLSRFGGSDEGAGATRGLARDFHWPEFDRWQAFFASHGHFPAPWEGLELAPAHGVPAASCEIYRRRKLILLLDWLHGVRSQRAEVRHALTRYARRGITAGVFRQDGAAPCPACDHLHGRVVGPEAALPPFHPGCRCLVLPLARR
jgi:hypothetical protein